MKVLIVHEIFLPEFSGGGERIMFGLAKSLKEKGIEVEVITSGNQKIKEYQGIKTVRIWFPGKILRRYFFNFLAIPFILKEGRKFDVIQTTTYNAAFPAWIAAKLLKKPVVCIFHGIYGEKWKYIQPEIFERLRFLSFLSILFSQMFEKFVAKLNFDRLIVLSNFSKKVLRKVRGNLKNCEMVIPGIKKKFKRRKKDPYVLFVGRLEKQKGFDILLKVAKKLPLIKFKIVGKPKSWIKEIPFNCKILGRVSEKKLKNLYEKALVFFLPSRAETLGLVILEAMAAGCVIVSTVPLDYRGFKIKEGESVESIAKKIEFLIKNKKLASEWGEENRKIVRKYSWEKFVEKMIKIYKEILKGRDRDLNPGLRLHRPAL